MKIFKKSFIILYLFLFYFKIYSLDYYICLGSFIDNKNSMEYSNNLNNMGIKTILEKVKIKNKYFIRVLYERKFSKLNDAIKELNILENNEIIKRENIIDLWIRPGKLLDTQIVVKTDSTVKSNVETKKEEIIKKDDIIKEEGKSNITEKKEEKIVKEDKIEEKKESEEKKVTTEIKEKKEEITKVEKYKIMSQEGYANCIFANEPIEYGKEDNYKLKVIFSKPEKIYARCYLPGRIGEIKNEDFWHEIWVDGNFIRKTFFKTTPDPSWDQIQIWISEDEYSDIINSLQKGEHKIVIWVLKNEKKEEKGITEIITIKLSKGEFTYIVQ